MADFLYALSLDQLLAASSDVQERIADANRAIARCETYNDAANRLHRAAAEERLKPLHALEAEIFARLRLMVSARQETP